MKTILIGSTLWAVNAPRPRIVSPRARRKRTALLVRAGTVTVLAATVGALALTAAPPPDRAQAAATAAPKPAEKREARLLGWQSGASGTKAVLQRTSVPATASAGPGDALFGGDPLGPALRFGGGIAVPASSFELGGFAPVRFGPATAAGVWQEEEFTRVAVEDGRTLVAGHLRIRLVGIDLPMPEQVCRTLDGRLESCASRASTQLELLTRWRSVTCRYRQTGSGEAIGQCRVGSSDLAERMIQTGYTWRSAATAPVRQP